MADKPLKCHNLVAVLSYGGQRAETKPEIKGIQGWRQMHFAPVLGRVTLAVLRKQLNLSFRHIIQSEKAWMVMAGCVSSS